MKKLKIKLCGMRREEDIRAANALGPDYIGYIFYEKSRRYVTPKAAAALTAMLDPKITPVGVFVNAEPAMILELLRAGTIRAVQLHGSEDNAYITGLRTARRHLYGAVPVWKAFGIHNEADVEAANASAADLVLLDSGNGGTGEVFDHGLLSRIRRPYLLAGGLNPDNIGPILSTLCPRETPASPEAAVSKIRGTAANGQTCVVDPGASLYNIEESTLPAAGMLCGVDVSSGIETAGIKDAAKMRQFVEHVRRY